MDRPPPFPPPPGRRRPPSSAPALWALMWVCLVPTVLGLGYAAAANASANQAGNPLAGLGVAMGLSVAVPSGAGAVLFGLAAWADGRRRGWP